MTESNRQTFIRSDLGKECTLEELAHSFLEGRLSRDTLISVDNNTMTFDELCLQIPIIQQIISESKEAKQHPQSNSEDVMVYSRRVALWRRIVNQGEPSLEKYISDLEGKTEDFSRLTNEFQKQKDKCVLLENQNSVLRKMCNNIYIGIQELRSILAHKKKSLSPTSKYYISYLEVFERLERITVLFLNQLQSNLSSSSLHNNYDETKTLANISIIDNYRMVVEEELENEKRKILDLKRTVDEEIQEKRDVLDTERDDLKNQINILKDNALSEINKKNDELIACMKENREFETRIRSWIDYSFRSFADKARCHISPNIPHNVFNSIINCGIEDSSFRSILFFYDTSFSESNSSGIIITSKCIFIINKTRAVQLAFSNDLQLSVKKHSLISKAFLGCLIPMLCFIFTIIGVIGFGVSDDEVWGVAFLASIISIIFSLFIAQVTPNKYQIIHRDRILFDFYGYFMVEFERICNILNNMPFFYSHKIPESQRISELNISIKNE